MARSRTGLLDLILDANVLIDFCDADRTVFRLISESVGRIHVPTPILREEVAQLSVDDCPDLGISPVEPLLETALLAAPRRSGVSFYDHLCLLLARDSGWTCVTNDGRKPSQSAARPLETLDAPTAQML